MSRSSSIRGAIEDALEATRGKIYGSDGAARRLGLPPATLQSKMKKLAPRSLPDGDTNLWDCDTRKSRRQVDDGSRCLTV